MPVLADETTVVPLLAQMQLPRHVLLEMASKIGGERANVAPHEPSAVIGFETWRWGTRFFREDGILKGSGWAICDLNQVAGIRHGELKIKLVCCGTDKNTGNPLRSPKNLSERRANSCKLIARNSGQFKMDFVEDEPQDDLWYFCSYFCDDFISLELSRPTSEIGGYITAYSHRIIIAQPGEIPGIRRRIVQEDFADVPKPQVTRKIG
jgi:hypothetical protein